MQSTLGRFFASILMVYGVIFTAMPLTIVGAEFVVARNSLKMFQKHKRHGAAWSVRHSEFTRMPEPLTEGNKFDVYHVVSDHYTSLSAYLVLLKRLARIDQVNMLADVRTRVVGCVLTCCCCCCASLTSCGCRCHS